MDMKIVNRDGKCVLSLDAPCKGVFTLPDTETDMETKTNTDTDTLTQNPMRICVDVCRCTVRTPPHNSIQPFFISICIDLGVGSVNKP